MKPVPYDAEKESKQVAQNTEDIGI